MRKPILHMTTALWIVSCSDSNPILRLPEEDGGPPQTATLPALANAGEDREVLRGYIVCLDGRGTTHPLGKPFTVHWAREDGEPVYLSNPGDLTPCFVAPLDEQTLTFTLTADDGTLATTDQVKLFVRKTPKEIAPLCQAGPDRVVAPEDPLEPTVNDVVSEHSDEIDLFWELVTPSAIAPQNENGMPAMSAAIYRLSAQQAEFGSAPDYLLLWPESETTAGQQAPVTKVTAPFVAERGATVELNATESIDANGDTLRWRFEQTRGDAAELLANKDGRIKLKLPPRPQELTFRVFARDQVLEASPATVVVAVLPAKGDPELPTVTPALEQITHPGNRVRLDALRTTPDAVYASDRILFSWEQTHGPTTVLTTLASGRFAELDAPGEPTDLAFSVVATDGTAVGDPTVVRLSVVPSEEHNDPPSLAVCTHTPEKNASHHYLITITAHDPEGDDVVAVTWAGTDACAEDVNEHPLEPAPLGVICDAGYLHIGGFDAAPPGVTTHYARVAPEAAIRSGCTVTVVACDAFGACGQQEITLPASTGP